MNRFSRDAGNSHFQAKSISWSMRTRGSVPRIHTNVKTNAYVLNMNQRIPATQSRPTYAHAPTSVTMNRLASTNPTMSACQALIRELTSQNGVANSRVRRTGPRPMSRSKPIPNDPGSNDRLTGHGQGNGAFQPPKKSVTMSAEMMKTFTYSAKKKNPKRMPEYSVAKPATISESASVRSNGVRFASAVAAMKKISTPSGCWKTHQSVNHPA